MSALLEVRGLTKRFPLESGIVMSRLSGHVSAVEDVSFEIEAGTTLGLVGESGCGKSTTGRCILGLDRPTSGEIGFDGRQVHSLSSNELKRVRREMQVVFQDPYASLNPRMTVGEIVSEPLVIHRVGGNGGRQERVAEVNGAVEVEDVGVVQGGWGG